MFDPCKLKNNQQCAFSYKNEYCGLIQGENKIEKMKKCPRLKTESLKAKK